MVVYTCPKCNKEFINKAHFEIHVNRKTSCVEEERKIEKNLFCPICNKLYSTRRSLNKHINTVCMIKKINEENKKKEEDEKNFLKNQITILQELINKNTNIDINTNIKNIQTNENISNYIDSNKDDKLDDIDSNSNNKLNDVDSITNNKLDGYFYILQEREFIKTNENIYKIGRTSKCNILDRFKQYPNNSILINYWKVKNMYKFESLIKIKFDLVFKRRIDIGYEYFEGDIDKMVDTIEDEHKICNC